MKLLFTVRRYENDEHEQAISRGSIEIPDDEYKAMSVAEVEALVEETIFAEQHITYTASESKATDPALINRLL